jgi:cytochrome c oxidase assembly protein subunit 15
VYLVYALFRNYSNRRNLISNSLVLLMVIVLEIASGAIMGYFAIPRFAQPVHLSLAALAFGLQFMLLLRLLHINKEAKHLKGKDKNASYQIH